MSHRQQTGLAVYASVGGAAFFEQLLVQWERDGWPVTRYHALQEEEYRAARSTLQRMWLRWRMYGAFAWHCWRITRQSRRTAPLRVVTTSPFFAPALVERTAKGSGATVNLLYDLYPDALVLSGVLSADSWLARRCAALTRVALRECAATVFLGDRLRRHAEAHYGAARLAVVIPVGADGAPFRRTPPKAVPGGLTLLYAGQMGRMHEVETISELLASGVPAGLQMNFHASGSGYERLRKSAGAVERCTLGGPLAGSAWQHAMQEAQVALVTMTRGAENIVMPSKTYSALVAGQAILAICASESDLADLVRMHDCGWVVEPGDVQGLRKVLASLAESPEELLRKRRNAFQAGHEHYDVAILSRHWTRLFDSLLAS